MQFCRELELLAPARNVDIGIAAIDCGADAVYIAGPRFGARYAAGNTIDDIARLCSYARNFGVRVFLTLNTILYDNELEDAYSLMCEAVEAGIDGIIVQDLAILELARRYEREHGSRFEARLHASTQCAIRTPEKARFYESLGFSRLVLERQMQLGQIRAIHDATGCELEFFIHGALCVCYSGQCYMSQAIAGRSANRGECIQACRSRYDLVDESGKVLARDKALLSLKDYNLKDRLGELADAGVNSFKIEGRLKGESYVRNVVRDYSIALDALVESSGGKYVRSSFGKVTRSFVPDTEKTFNRGYTSLFIDGQRGDWAAIDTDGGTGEAIGTIASVTRTGKDSMDLRISLNNNILLRNGDGFAVSTGKGMAGFRGDVCKGSVISCKFSPDIRKGMKIFRNISAEFEKAIQSAPCTRLVGVTASLLIEGKAEEGYRMTAEAVSEDGRIASCADIIKEASKADNVQRMRDIMAGQLSKTTGLYSFRLDNIKVQTTDGSLPWLTSACLNDIRRRLASILSETPVIARPLAEGREDSGTPAPKEISYKDNVSNSLSRKIYESRTGSEGPGRAEAAFEIDPKEDAELMRTKYCIRHQLGICPRQHKGKDVITSQLFLMNNGRRFALHFDCKNCEMTVSSC